MHNMTLRERKIYGDDFLEIALDTKAIIFFQEQMINENHLRGFLPFYSKVENETCLYYKITGYQNLSGSLGASSLTKRRYLRVLETAAAVLMLCERYMLSENALLMHPDFIYGNDEEIVFAYVPAEFEKDIKTSLKELLFWMNHRLDIRQEGAGDAAFQLQRLTDGSYTWKDLKDKIEALSAAKPVKPVTPPPAAQPPIRPVIPRTPAGTGPIQPNAFPAAAAEKKIRKPRKPAPTRPDNPKRKGFANFFPWNAKQPPKAQPDAKENPEPRRKPSHEPDAPMPDPARKEGPGARPKTGKARLDTQAVRETRLEEAPTMLQTGSTLDGGKKRAFLSGEDATVEIQQDMFRMGRQRGAVDFVIPEMSISRIHAQIHRIHNNFYIEDLDSTGGTFVNYIRLEANTPIKIKNGDAITLYKKQFVFKTEPY